MKFKEFLESFRALVDSVPAERLDDSSRYVFLSDLHMGDGGPRDDLAANGALAAAMLEDWYLPRGFVLVLNGDVEDVQKFDLPAIRAAWPGLYAVFAEFASRGRLRKIVGNHDLSLLGRKDYPFELRHALVLEKHGRRLCAFHGHQASRLFVRYDYLSEFIVRYLAKPLRIKNTSVAGDSRRRYAAERRIYRAARALGIVAVAGHTHRPLFESMSKYDGLRWSLEDLLREYPAADAERKAAIAELVDVYRRELGRLEKKRGAERRTRNLYGEGSLLVPCLFNSGCATGKHGATALELEDGNINLVQWAGRGKARAFVEREAMMRDSIRGGEHARYLLKTDRLDHVFARMELLGKA